MSMDNYTEVLKEAYDIATEEKVNVGVLLDIDTHIWRVGPKWAMGEHCPDSTVVLYVGPGPKDKIIYGNTRRKI